MLHSELYRALWRRKVLVLVGTLLCVVLALVLTGQQQKLYTATATVRVEPLATNNANDSFEASQRLSRSYAEIYTQGAVIAGMSRLMAGQSPPKRTELAGHQLKDLDLLEISGIASNPRRAAVIANVGARALENFSSRERLIPITPATVPRSPSSPNVRLSVMLALVAGFILSAGVALLLDALLQPIPAPDELERSLDVPVLAVVPRLDLAIGSGPLRDGEAAPRVEGARGVREIVGVGASSGVARRLGKRLRGEGS